MAQCSSCSHLIRDGLKFCTSCGAPQLVPTVSAADPRSVPAPASAILSSAEELGALWRDIAPALAVAGNAPATDDPGKSLLRRGLGFASTTSWSEASAGGQRIALSIRGAAIQARDGRKPLSRGDIVAAHILPMAAAGLPVSGFSAMQRSANGMPRHWGVFARGIAPGTLAIFAGAGRSGSTPVERRDSAAKVLTGRTGADHDE